LDRLATTRREKCGLKFSLTVALAALASACSEPGLPTAARVIEQALQRHGLRAGQIVRLEGSGQVKRSIPEGEFGGTFLFWAESDDKVRREEEFYHRRATFGRLGSEVWSSGAPALTASPRPALEAGVLSLLNAAPASARALPVRFEQEPAVTCLARHPRLGTVRCWFSQKGGALLGLEFRREGRSVRLSFALPRSVGTMLLPFHYVCFVNGVKDEEGMFETLRPVLQIDPGLFIPPPRPPGSGQ
jgi:hypothetical protein